MKVKRFLLIAFLSLTALFCGACAAETGYNGKTKIVFELEGGTYQNCNREIVHYYDFAEGSQNLIYEPSAVSKKEITKANYTLEGWYQTKTVDGDLVSYSDPWDFATDWVDTNGITLYAKWKKNVNHVYSVCYYDENDEVQELGKYENIEQGEKFDDWQKFANKRSGYTALEYQTEDGEPWDENFTHPGGESDVTVRVFVNYIEGRYSIVRTASELKKSTSQNIYLAADIDMEGNALKFGDYKYTFLGNGHTIKNFTVQYDGGKNALKDDLVDNTRKCITISLFGNTDGAVIKNVCFEDVTIDVSTDFSKIDRIYVAPISVDMKNTTVDNVTFSGTFGYSKLPKELDAATDLVFVTDRVYYQKDEKTTVDRCQTTIEVKNKTEE